MNEIDTKIKELWQELSLKKENFQFSETKFLTDKLEANVKILNLLDEKIKSVNQLPEFGLIILNQTILSSHNKTSISEQGIIGNDFFKARVIDVDNTIVKGVCFHLVKVISGIVTINLEHELTLVVDENFRKQLNSNKIIAKLFNLFSQDFLKLSDDLIKKFKFKIDEKSLKLKFSKTLNITKKSIFEIRNTINEFLSDKKINYQKYPFLKDVFSRAEKETIADLELIEIKSFEKVKNNFNIEFLVGSEKVNDFLLENKKELLSAIRIINRKIKLINNEKLSEFHPESIIDSYEKLEKLNQNYLKLKQNFLDFQNQNPELIEGFIDESMETHYSEKIGAYEFVHINFNNLLIDQDLLEAKALEKTNLAGDKILFLSNNNLDNSMVLLKISENLIDKINIVPLVNQFSNSSFKKITYFSKDGVFIEANNYQVINDFISNIINFFKISNNQTI